MNGLNYFIDLLIGDMNINKVVFNINGFDFNVCILFDEIVFDKFLKVFLENMRLHLKVNNKSHGNISSNGLRIVLFHISK